MPRTLTKDVLGIGHTSVTKHWEEEEGGGRQIPEAGWTIPASVVNSILGETGIRWREMEEDRECQPLPSPCTNTNAQNQLSP